MLHSLLPVDRTDQAVVEYDHVLVLHHRLQPQVERVLDLQDLEELAENVDELADIDLYPHLLALLRDFGDEVDDQADEVVGYQLLTR